MIKFKALKGQDTYELYFDESIILCVESESAVGAAGKIVFRNNSGYYIESGVYNTSELIKILEERNERKTQG